MEAESVGALGSGLGGATEDQGLEPLADPRSSLPGDAGTFSMCWFATSIGLPEKGCTPTAAW